MENAKTANNLTGTRFAFIGSGVMAESMIAGLLREEIVSHEQIVASHPRANRRDELAERYKIQAFERNADAVRLVREAESSIVVLSIKPQRLSNVLRDLEGILTDEQLLISIVAGATIETLSAALGTKRIVRAMPNTPAQVGHGITA